MAALGSAARLARGGGAGVLKLQRAESPASEDLLAPVLESLDRACLFAGRVLGDRALAEDAVQEACARYLRRPPEDRGEGTLSACFMRMVYASAVDLLRSERARRAREEAQPVNAERTGERPDRAAAAAEAARAAQRALAGLPRQMREAVCLCCEEGFTQGEASAILGVPLGTVADRVRRGLERLRASLAAAGFGALGLPALGEALGALRVPAAPARVVRSVQALAAGSKAGAAGGAGGGAAAATIKGGLALKTVGGLICAAAVAAGLAAVSGGGASSPSAGGGGGGDWRNERWTVEEFTDAMGGGPSWGSAAGAGGTVKSMVQDEEGNFFLVCGQRIDIITAAGVRYKLAGTGTRGYRDGPAEEALFRMGEGAYYGYSNIGVDDRGNVFVPDNGNSCVRRIFKSPEGRWLVETYAGGGTKELKKGESCAPRQAKIYRNLHVAVAPDGTLTIGGGTLAWRIPPDGRTIICLGGWPASINKKRPVPVMNICGGGADKHGNAYFGARTTDVVCRVDKDGKIEHVAGALFESRGAGWKVGDGPPLKVFFDTPSSTFVDINGHVLYMCGGDEYDIRRVPTDMKSTTATLLMNGRWYVMNIHPNKNRGKPVFDPDAAGKPGTEGGKLTDFMCAPLVGIDREGNLYGKLNRWTGMTQEVKGKGLLHTRVFKIRRVK